MAVEKVIGPLPCGWHYTTLGEQCAIGGGGIQTGPFGSQLHAYDYVPDGIPSIMPQNIGDNLVEEEGIARITEFDAERLAKYRVNTGDIVYSRRGNVEKRALIRGTQQGWLCGTGCLRVRFASPTVNPTYASYYLAHPKVRSWIVRHAHGATMPNLNTGILSALPFVVPPVTEQRAIAHILGSLDDKIELNRRMNETLERIARALFKSWFVDFDPVRAKAEGRQPVGMDAETAALFPDSFEDSELGLIPAGWEVTTIGNLAEETIGGDWGRNEYFDGAEQAVVLRGSDLQDVRESGFAHAAPVRWVRRKSVENRALESKDVLIGGSGAGPIGRSLWCAEEVLRMFELPVLYSNFCKRIRALSREHAIWLDDYLNEMRLAGAHLEYATGTSIPNLDLKGLLTTRPLAVPPEAILYLYAKLRDLCWKRHLLAESRVLASIRDTLLPKLISGELRVPVPEKFLAEAPI